MSAASLVPWSWLAFVAATSGASTNGKAPAVLHVEIHQGSCANPTAALSYEAALARTEPEKERGLGIRKNALAKGEAMLFVYDTPGPRTYWMKDTHIPLAIFYFDDQGKALSSAEMPVEKDPTNPKALYPEPGAVTAVLEVEKGVTRKAKAGKLDTLCIPGPAKP